MQVFEMKGSSDQFMAASHEMIGASETTGGFSVALNLDQKKTVVAEVAEVGRVSRMSICVW